ncbi:MAG: hypothetical protein ABSB76_18045 [Streptosporangiaceae bacterium]
MATNTWAGYRSATGSRPPPGDRRPHRLQHPAVGPERGHATAMLAAALPVARSLGITRALLTSDEDNLASRKVIEANGGVLEDKSSGKVRYWVPAS